MEFANRKKIFFSQNENYNLPENCLNFGTHPSLLFIIRPANQLFFYVTSFNIDNI